MEENHEHYDGQGLKGALWTLAGTAIATTAMRFINGGGGLLGVGAGGMGVAQSAALAVDAAKDARIARLEADAETDRKLVEVYKSLRIQDKEQDAKIADLNTRVTTLETSSPLRERIVLDRVDAVANLAQNGIATNSAALANLAATVGDITKRVVPITAVCPEPMPRYNSFTAPTAAGDEATA